MRDDEGDQGQGAISCKEDPQGYEELDMFVCEGEGT